MEEILLGLLEVVFEATFWAPLDFGSASRRRVPKEVVRTRGRMVWTALLSIVVGASLAALTLWIWPRAFVRSFPLRLTHCLLTPFLAAFLASVFERRRSGPHAPPLGVGAWRAYFLTAGFAFTRFFFAG